MKTILTVLAIWLVVMVAAAQPQPGYEIVRTAPSGEYLPLGTTVGKDVLDVNTRTWTRQTFVIEGYVTWINPPRPTDYYCTLIGTNVWYIWNRETVEQGR